MKGNHQTPDRSGPVGRIDQDQAGKDQIIRGKALVIWADRDRNRKMDNIDTDQITPSGYCITPSLEQMDRYWKEGAFRHLVPDFRERVAKGCNFLVVGDRFGIGSSREMSPAALMAVAAEAGTAMVIVCGRDAASIFLRNAVNLGLPVLQCPEAVADARDTHSFAYEPRQRRLKNLSLGKTYTPLPPAAADRAILDAGGLIAMGRQFLDNADGPGTAADPMLDRELTYTQALVNRHRTDGETGFEPGSRIPVVCDLLPASDGTAPFAIWAFEQTVGDREITPKNAAIVFDHFVFTGDERHLRQAGISTAFIEKYTLPPERFTRPGEGIFHIILPEKGLVRPGDLCAGADSHTRSLGAYGALGFGVGSTELGVGWATGTAFFPVGKQVRIRFLGRLRPWVSGKDAGLSLVAKTDALGLRGSHIEFVDGDLSLSMADRHTICNLMAEAEAISALFVPDAVTDRWCRERGLDREPDAGPAAAPDGGETAPGDAPFDRVEAMDLGALSPVAALPFSPANIVSLEDPGLEHLPLDKVFIGSCTNGMYQDLLRAAMVIHGSDIRSAAPGVEFLVYPGSREILAQCRQGDDRLGGRSVLEVLEGAGAVIRPSWCGPCFGLGQDRLTPGQVAVATFNRNWKNRSGTGGRVILTGPESAAASALAGYLTGPRPARGD